MGKIIFIGNFRKKNGWDNPQVGRVYSARGIAPTITTICGGNQEPKILVKEIKKIVKIVGYTRDREKGKVQSYHLKNIANTLHCGGGTTAQYVLEYTK